MTLPPIAGIVWPERPSVAWMGANEAANALYAYANALESLIPALAARIAALEGALALQYTDVTMRVEWERDRQVCIVVETDSGKSPEAFRTICRLLGTGKRAQP